MEQVFRRISFQSRPPEPSWTEWKHKTLGRLVVGPDRAEFTPKRGSSVAIENILRVAKGWEQQVHGRPLIRWVDTYIEILYGDPASPTVAYVNDVRWFYLASYLPHRKLMAALESLVRPN